MSEISNEVIKRAALGDMAAFEEIYKSTSGFVYNVVLRITNNRNDADEVTQDVFVKVYNNLKDFGFRSSFKTWIYRIAANTAINHSKKSARYDKPKVEYDPAVHDIEVPPDTQTKYDKEESHKNVEALLDILDQDQRACIVLREIEGLGYQEIADALHIKLNTVRSRLKRARQKLLVLRQAQH